MSIMTELQAANAERKAVRAKLQRSLRDASEETREVLVDLITWLNKRDDRYNKRPGGLQKRKPAGKPLPF